MNDRNTAGIVKDALALIAAAERNDRYAVNAMIASYEGDHNERDRGALVGAMLAHSVAILRTASCVTGAAPASILGAVAASLDSAAA